jgi:hypothetical protein
VNRADYELVRQSRSNAFKFRESAFVDDIAGVQSRCRLEEQNAAFFVGDRAMLDSSRHDDEFSLLDPLVAIAEFHAESPLHNQKQLVFIFVMMENELAFELAELHHLTVKFGGYARFPGFLDLSEFVGDIDFVHAMLLQEGQSGKSRFLLSENGRKTSLS